MKLKLFSSACFLLILSTACSPTPSEKAATEDVKNETVVAKQNYLGDNSAHERSLEHSDHVKENELVHASHQQDEKHEKKHEHAAHQHDEKHQEKREHAAHQHDEKHQEKHEHGVHEHGRATLTVAWSKKDLAIDLQTPAYNILGFEYAPSTTEEKKRVIECIETLKTEGLIEASIEARCAIIAADVQTGFGAENKSEEEKTNHSDFDVFYTVKCQNPDALKTIDTGGLFAAFSNLTTLQVQWISDRGQSAQTLTPKHPILSFD